MLTSRVFPVPRAPQTKVSLPEGTCKSTSRKQKACVSVGSVTFSALGHVIVARVTTMSCTVSCSSGWTISGWLRYPTIRPSATFVSNILLMTEGTWSKASFTRYSLEGQLATQNMSKKFYTVAATNPIEGSSGRPMTFV